MNNSRYYRIIKPLVSSSFGDGAAIHSPLLGTLRHLHLESDKRFSLIDPLLDRESLSNYPANHEILGPGMVLLKNFICHKDQVEIVNICEKWAVGPGGFRESSHENGAKLPLQMMSFGRRWDPVTKYDKYGDPDRCNGCRPLPIPNEFMSLAKTAVQKSQERLEQLPSMHPDICLVNFYQTTFQQLAFHQDKYESSDSLQKGLPVVSISIGDSAEFIYGYTKAETKAWSVLLQSGDVLIFGGKSRLIFHGVKNVFKYTTPPPLIKETGFRSGRLNLTFRQF